jgi:regulator of protease activity HflC (stomatin/prohibitin superfamily)
MILDSLSLPEMVIVTFFITLFGIMIIAKSLYIVRQAEVIIIERLGKYHKTLLPGFHVIVPFIDAPHEWNWSGSVMSDTGKIFRTYRSHSRIDLREIVDNFPKQNVITKDNVTMEIGALMYYQIYDPKDAAYQVANLPDAIERLTQTTLRNVIGALDLDETLVSRDKINEKLKIILDHATHKWGVKVNRVELQEVNPPRDIQQAMEKQMRAERDRRAVILEAEGEKRSAILRAEGAKEAAILDAEGERESGVLRAKGISDARIIVAQAEADAIIAVKKAIPNGDPLPYMIAREYIKTLPEITKDKHGKMILVPYEASALAGSLATIKQLFESDKK